MQGLCAKMEETMTNETYKQNSESFSTLGVLSRNTYDRLLYEVWEAELEGSIDLALRMRLMEILGASGFENIPNSLEAIDQRLLDLMKESLGSDFRTTLRTRLVDLLYGPNHCRLEEVSLRRKRMAKLFDDRRPAAQS